MTTKYRTPDGKLNNWSRDLCLVTDSNGAPHIGVTKETFGDIPGCSIVEVPDPAPVEPVEPAYYVVSKLALRRALREWEDDDHPQGWMETVLDSVLASNPQAAADWADATSLRSDDPMLTAMLPVIATAAGMTAEQAEALMRTAAEASM